MGWDSSRPVPWDRMVREWLIYVAIMLVVLLLFFRSMLMNPPAFRAQPKTGIRKRLCLARKRVWPGSETIRAGMSNTLWWFDM